MLKYILISSLIFCSCSIDFVRKELYKTIDVEVFYDGKFQYKIPATQFVGYKEAYDALQEIYDAEIHSRISISKHPSIGNTYVIIWYSSTNRVVKKLIVELYEPIEKEKEKKD